MDTLPQLTGLVDAWFLDGFAPARNPDMWDGRLLGEIARLSHSATTFATFTSAAAVRRGLIEVGFDVEKIKGFASKREMLRGQYTGKTASLWVSKPSVLDRTAIVIGGGIAGVSTAFSLAQRGFRVTLIERHAHLAAEASGNAQAVLYPRLSGHDIALSRIAIYGFLYTISLLKRSLPQGWDWSQCGLLQLGFNSREAKRCQEVLARGLVSGAASQRRTGICHRPASRSPMAGCTLQKVVGYTLQPCVVHWRRTKTYAPSPRHKLCRCNKRVIAGRYRANRA